MRDHRNPVHNALLGVFCLSRRMYCSDEWVEIFRDIASRDWKVRLAWSIFEFVRGTWFGTSMLVVFGSFSALRCALKRSTEKQLVTLAIYQNESAALNRLEEILAPVPLVRNDNSLANCLRSLTRPSVLWLVVCASVRSFRLLSKASRRDHFVSLCQSASLLACYALFLDQLAKMRPRAIFISSASIPQPLALAAAARALDIPSLFASHASFALNGKALVPPADAILMDGMISLEACRQVSRRPFVPILWGVAGSCRKVSLPEKPLSQLSIGLFLTAPVVMSGVQRILSLIYENIRPARVILRPHPIAMLTPNLDNLATLFPGVIIKHGESLESCIEKCDLVLAGNSNVHREVLRAGVPSLYVPYLDTIEYDYWGFVSKRITLEAGDLEGFSLNLLGEFYDESWAKRFSAYDAGYLESAADVRARVKGEIERFLRAFREVPVCSREGSRHSETVSEGAPQRSKEEELALRVATLSDSDLLLEWRNEEAARQNSSSSIEISFEEHSRWYESVINSPLSRIYILMKGATPVGQIRFDMSDEVAILSYSIDKAYRGQGLGSFIVTEGIREARMAMGDRVKMRASVKPDNLASLRILQKTGFIVRETAPSGLLIFERDSL